MSPTIDLTASSDDEPSSRHARIRRPNGFHDRNAGTPPGTVDLTIDEPPWDPYLMSGTLGSPMPRSLPNPYKAPASSPRETGPKMSRSKGIVRASQGPPEGEKYTPTASDQKLRANSPTLPPAPTGHYQTPVRLAHPMDVDSTAAIAATPFSQGFDNSLPIGFAAPDAPKSITITTRTRDEANDAMQLHYIIAMHPHPQSPVAAQIAPKSKSADPTHLHASNAQGDKENSPLARANATSMPPRTIRSPSIEEAVNGSVADAETRLRDLRQSVALPLTIESLQESLQKAFRETRSDHQYYVKSHLPRERYYRSKSLIGSNKSLSGVQDGRAVPEKPDGFIRTNSLFAELTPLRTDQSFPKADDIGKLCQLGPKVTKQGPEVTTVRCIKYTAGDLTIPPYTNYISTKRNILTEDDKNRTFLPYYGDDAAVDRDYAELESRITRNRFNYHRSNAIAEKARLYGPYAERFLTDIGCSVSTVLRYLLDETRPQLPEGLPQELATIWRNREVHLDSEYYDDSEDSRIGKSRTRLREKKPQKKWRAVFHSIPPPATSREYAVAGIACAVFASMADFSLWHVVRRHRLVTDITSRKLKSFDSPGRTTYNAPSAFDSAKFPNLLDTYTDLGCLVCYAHECPGHGEFDDEDEDKNIRVRINAKPDSPTIRKRQSTEAQLISNGTDFTKSLVQDAVGLNDDKVVSGQPWTKFKDEDSGFKDDELCSDHCFWLKNNRSTLSSAWSEPEIQLFNTLVPVYIDIRRGPCFIAIAVEKPCFEVFLKVLRFLELPSSMTSKSRHGGASQGSRPAPRRHFDHWLENSITWEHHERPPFKPCNHLGPCSALTNCRCFEDKVTCEKTCMCANNCSRRYRGCTCAARGKVCWQNEKCDCYRLNRECDPDLCVSCGAHEVLDPVNRYRPNVTDGKCANVYVQRGIPRRTLLGHSRLLASGGVDGWGLYMGEATRKGDYIGEYVGEVISKEESEQRGIIYNKRNLSYLFDLNSTQTLDSTLVGNKFRYINHQAPPYANCQAKTLFCNTVHRIGMFACRNIEVGEEILFDYGEGFAAKFNLIQLDENAQPRIEKRRKGVAYAKLPDKGPTLSKNGKRIGRPRKNVPSDQGGVKENITQPAASVTAPATPKRSHKRKRSAETFGLDGAADGETAYEDVLLSDEPAEEISSSESFHESDDEDTRARRRRRAKATKSSTIQKRGWRAKVGRRGGKSGRGGRPRKERGLGRPESRGRGGKRGNPRKSAIKPTTVKMEQVEDVFGGVANFDLEALHAPIIQDTPPGRRGSKTRHSAVEKGKEVDRGENDEIEVRDYPQADRFTSAVARKRGSQPRHSVMTWSHKANGGQNVGEGSSAAPPTEGHSAPAESPKRALKSYSNIQKRRDISSVLKHRRRG